MPTTIFSSHCICGCSWWFCSPWSSFLFFAIRRIVRRPFFKGKWNEEMTYGVLQLEQQKLELEIFPLLMQDRLNWSKYVSISKKRFGWKTALSFLSRRYNSMFEIRKKEVIMGMNSTSFPSLCSFPDRFFLFPLFSGFFYHYNFFCKVFLVSLFVWSIFPVRIQPGIHMDHDVDRNSLSAYNDPRLSIRSLLQMRRSAESLMHVCCVSPLFRE